MPKQLKPQGQAAPPVGADSPPARRKAPTRKPAKKTVTDTSYIRNTRGVLVRLTLDSGRRIMLEPRGARGDLASVNSDERVDSLYRRNLGLLFEELTVEQGMAIQDAQNTNRQVNAPRPERYLTNEHGKPMRIAEDVAIPFEQQGITVAHIEQTGPTVRMEQGEALHRGVGPERMAVPGTVDNPGVTPEYSDAVSEVIGEGGELRVSVDPPRRT